MPPLTSLFAGSSNSHSHSHNHPQHSSPSPHPRQQSRTLVAPTTRIRIKTNALLRWGSLLLTVLFLAYTLLVLLPFHLRLTREGDEQQLLTTSRLDPPPPPSSRQQQLQLQLQQQQIIPKGRCAINFYGLPRAFKALVLPSVVKNVILPNARYNCDYFVHYYEQTEEAAGRSGGGGHIDPHQILLLQEQVEVAAKRTKALNSNIDADFRMPIVAYAKDREEDFWKQYETIINKIRTTKDANDRYLYFPWKAKTYVFPDTTDNILKQWHSIQASWQLMEATAKQDGGFEYDRVAMLRSDVVYATPIDIWDRGTAGTGGGKQPLQLDVENRVAVLPGFGKHPVSDRLVYGPAGAVKIWAAERFRRMDRHVLWILQHDPGWGLHSERFMNYALFPAMKQARPGGIELVEHPYMCFFRARADASVWVSDCEGDESTSLPTIMENLGSDKKAVVEKVLDRKCGDITKTKHPRMDSLNCSTLT